MSEAEKDQGLWLLYDGDCLFCNTTVKRLRLKKSVGALHILNIRENLDHALVRKAKAAELDLNRGIVAYYGDRAYHAEEALHLLACLSSNNDLFNRLNSWLFSAKWRATFAYPVLVFARSVLLFVLNRKPL